MANVVSCRPLAETAKDMMEPQFLILALSFSLCIFVVRRLTNKKRVFMLRYEVFKPSDDRKCNAELAEYFVHRSEKFGSDNFKFQKSVYMKSGLGDETYIPPFIFKEDYEDVSLVDAWAETGEAVHTTVSNLFNNCNDVRANDIGIVVTVCSIFNPVPSLASHIVNRYGMKEDVKSFHLSGMGCSGGAIALDLATRLLSNSRQRTYALVVITENISQNWYAGNNKSMLLTNCLFRVGCAAVLLSNYPHHESQAKMEVMLTLRTHLGYNDTAYRAAFQEEDEDGMVGISLKKDLVPVAGEGLARHLRILGPLVLPYSEMLRYVIWAVKGRMLNKEKMFVPNMSLSFEHFCIHTGGKAVINNVGKNLGLSDEKLEPSRMALHRFGNTSSSLVLYVLSYMEAKRIIKKGDRIWILAFGTGFKVSSLVFRALQHAAADPDSVWADCIHRYPVHNVF